MYPDETHPTKGVFVRNAEQQLIAAGLNVNRVVLRNTPASSRLTKLWAYLTFTMAAIVRLMRNTNPVYVHYVAHTGLPLILAHAFRAQTVIAHAHGGDVIAAPHESPLTQSVKHFLSRRVLSMAKTVIVPSQFLASRLTNDFGVPDDKIIIIPSGGVDTQVFHYRKRLFKGKDDTLRVGYVGRIDRGKGVDTLIHALNACKAPVQCTIAGTGNANDSIRELIADLQLNKQIAMLGSCEQRQLGDIYRQLDFLIFPSELEESLGLVGLESMACGTPVIGSRKGGMAEYIIDDVNGLGFAPGSAQSLCEAITSAYKMPSEKYVMMSSRAYQTSKAYDATHCAQRLLKVFL